MAYWEYDILTPTTELLAAVPQHHFDFVAQDYHSHDIYITDETVTLGTWQALPLTAMQVHLHHFADHRRGHLIRLWVLEAHTVH